MFSYVGPLLFYNKKNTQTKTTKKDRDIGNKIRF